MKKLIIWDFDGVISDTENLWIQSRMDLLNKDLNLEWDFDTTYKNIGGMSDRDKKVKLKNLGINVKDTFWSEIINIDIQKMNNGLVITPYIEEIFKLDIFDQCIATGGVYSKTKVKLEKTGADKYFPDDKLFTVDLVEKGKPEPDLFLLAAKKMNYEPKDCFVIEDSIVGLTAALRAKMTPIAFIKYTNPKAIEEIKKMNIPYIFDDMRDVKEFLLKNPLL